MKEALLLEMNDNNKKMIVSVIYRSPSQNNREFSSFLLNFDAILSDISTRKPTVSKLRATLMQDPLPGGLMTLKPWKTQIYIRSHPQTDFLN